MDGIYSTAQVAKEVGVDQVTLLRWLQSGEVPEPMKIEIGHDRRAWTKAEIEAVKRYKETHYRKRR